MDKYANAREFTYDRTADVKLISELADSIKNNGQSGTVFVDENMVVIEGNKRVQACEKLGCRVRYRVI